MIGIQNLVYLPSALTNCTNWWIVLTAKYSEDWIVLIKKIKKSDHRYFKCHFEEGWNFRIRRDAWKSYPAESRTSFKARSGCRWVCPADFWNLQGRRFPSLSLGSLSQHWPTFTRKNFVVLSGLSNCDLCLVSFCWTPLRRARLYLLNSFPLRYWKSAVWFPLPSHV